MARTRSCGLSTVGCFLQFRDKKIVPQMNTNLEQIDLQLFIL